MRPGDRILAGSRQVTALLGPTNTGKTHRAIHAMLRHPSGMIGLPLRLLAREVYDRVVALRGEQSVALVTGEEKRIPAGAAYFVCTVEAMPMERQVAFLCVDEIQLAGDPNRGHKFTDRILHARGVLETVFLGSETIAPLLLELVPDIRIEQMPRLSKLTWAGVDRLSRVPSRSAVVAFSAEQVYRHAERLRASHGGVAVVLGALSPRTRNAQVSLYESGDVQHLVATDAIGMGLNLDLRHVSFAGLRKFDGRHFRDLRTDELAQIAGRAGRYKTDGSFGTLREVGPLEPDQILALEAHVFPPLTRLYWRNADLDFRSVAALLDTLRMGPPHPQLKPVYDEADHRTLEEVAAKGDLPLDGEGAVQTLWDVCRIPDFRKTLTGAHAEMLHRIAGHLLEPNGRIPDDWIGRRLERLDRPEGDIDALMARIAYVRTWTYVAHQRDWLRDPGHWQGRTRQLEERLSDALHEALRRRFVGERPDRRRRLPPPDPQELIRFDLVSGADDGDFLLDPGGKLWLGDQALGALSAGDAPDQPRVLVSVAAFPSAARRTVVRLRLQAVVDARLDRWFAPLRAQGGSPAVREVLAAVRVGLGGCRRADVRHALAQLDDEGRADLTAAGLVPGRATIYASNLLEPEAVALRSTLWAVFNDEPGRLVPGGAPDEFPRTADAPADWLRAIGYAVDGDRAVRIDRHER